MNDEKTQIDAYRAGFTEGTKHTEPSIETLRLINVCTKETTEMRDEWNELKRRAFWMLVGTLSLAIGYGIWVGSIQVTIHNNQARILDNTQEVHGLISQNQNSQIALAEIRTKLANIEAILIEIKKEK